MRLVDADNLRGRMVNGNDKITIDCAPTIDPLHAAGGCYCRECKHSRKCSIRDMIELLNFKHEKDVPPFCSYGEPREAQDDG